MTEELFTRFAPVKDLVDELRSRVLPVLEENPELYYESDLKKFKEDDLFVHKYIAHQSYLRFPNHRNYDEVTAKEKMKAYPQVMDKAAEMVKDDLKWRKEFGVKGIKREEFPDEYFDRKAVSIYNEDLQGRAVAVLRIKCLRKTKPGEKPLGERFVIYWVEHIYEMNNKGITIILDCASAGPSNVNMDLVYFAHFIFRHHYPCYLGYFLVYNMPWIFEAVWNVIRRFLPVAGVERIKFVDQKSILEYIDKSNLSTEMGGTDATEFQYDMCTKDIYEEDTSSKGRIHNNMETVPIDL